MNSSAIRGVVFALLAAACFGITTPVLALYQGGVAPFVSSTLLSVGMILAAFGSALFGRNGPSLTWTILPRLVVSAILGAVAAPALLTFGIARANGVVACLLLNFEAVFTAFLGVLMYRERIGWRFALGITAITVGAILLMTETTTNDEEFLGLLAVASATALWAADNTLTRPFARFDSSQVMLVKGSVGGALAALLAIATATGPATVPVGLGPACAVIACGLVGYGGMERFYLIAQRTLGVARTSSLFAVSPFFGAALALYSGIPTSPVWFVAAAVMAFGVYLHATDGGLDPDETPDGETSPPSPPRSHSPTW
jgi:drug/metabolite transporter (DMT)-like permease